MRLLTRADPGGYRLDRTGRGLSPVELGNGKPWRMTRSVWLAVADEPLLICGPWVAAVACPRRAGAPAQSPVAGAPAAPRSGAALTSSTGVLLRDGNFRRRVWRPAVAKAGLSATHFHDLRHTGNTLTATAGASLRELMDRMGHSSPRAALIYLHGSDARQRAIAGW
jgi:hypothetical protein